VVAAGLVLVGVAAAFPHPGDLDPSFGGGGSGSGRVYVAPEAGPAEAHAVAVQADGKLVVAGYADSNTDFAVMRLNADGSLDTTFGSGGRRVVPSGAAQAIALQKDGKIVVAGRLGTNHLGIVRLTTAGALDPSFGVGGKLTVTVGTGSDSFARSVAVQADGKIVVAGYATFSTGSKAVVGRFTTSGGLDTSFGSSGWFSSAFGMVEGSADGVAVQPDGKLVVVGSGYTKGARDEIAFARLTSAGALDPTFGSGGTRLVADPGGGDNDANGLALQPDGKIVAAGDVYTTGTDKLRLVRVDSSGNLDATFGSGGIATPTALTRVSGAPAGIAVQADGKLVVPVAVVASGKPIFAIARYLSNGAVDTDFGPGGQAQTRFGIFTSEDDAYAVTIQPDGKIVGVGATGLGDAGLQWAAARFLPEGARRSGVVAIPEAILDGAFSFNIICPGGGRTCSGTVTIVMPIPSCERRRRVVGCTLGGRRYRVPAGGLRTLQLPLNARGARYARRHPGGNVVFLMDTGKALRRITASLKEQPSLVTRCVPTAPVGGRLVASGWLSPPQGTTSVTVRFHSPSGQETSVTMPVGSDGAFSADTAAGEAGPWTAVALWGGTSTAFATVSRPCGTEIAAPEQAPPPPPPPPPRPPPQKQSSSLTLMCPSSWQRGAALPVTGTLTPGLAGESIGVVYKPAQGTSTSRSVTTATGGSYSDHGYVPGQTGTLTVRASWPGNASYDGSSAACTVSVS
jgi:uncharacterized delta-60 repeat protein